MSKKSNTAAYADELRAIIDGVSKVIADSAARGFRPTFSVKYGVLGLVATYPIAQKAMGRPPKVDGGDIIETED